MSQNQIMLHATGHVPKEQTRVRWQERLPWPKGLYRTYKYKSSIYRKVNTRRFVLTACPGMAVSGGSGGLPRLGRLIRLSHILVWLD